VTDVDDTIGNAVRCDEIARQGELAAGLWASIVLDADRQAALTLRLHIRQVLAVTEAVLTTVAELETSHVGK
jgi:hypothetical protein